MPPGPTVSARNTPGKNGLELKIVPSEWEKHGLKGTMMRNEVLLRSADFVICFWDGESEGTRHMLDISRRAKKLLAEVRPDGFLRLFLNPRLLT